MVAVVQGLSVDLVFFELLIIMMRWSQQLIPTLRETPQEAEIPSHRWMLRAGLIRRLSGGLYTYLPLGFRAMKKVEAIVREEMNRANAREILMPALQPRDIWESSGRWTTLERVMFAMQDRQGRNMVLGPTHEEVITGLAANELDSYRDLPMNFYQIQTKFRDEIRPRFGLMRAKEFIMKDAYSFDADEEGIARSYQSMYEAYGRIFARCGLETTIVEADSGAMGGSASHEFMVVSEVGEDGIVVCGGCGYAANLERAEAPALPMSAEQDDSERHLEPVATPDLRSVVEVAEFLGLPTDQLIKTLIYLKDGDPVAVLVPGDRDINEVKLGHVLGAIGVKLADDAVVEQVTGAPTGFAGPVGLSLPLFADCRLEGRRGMVAGANLADTHILHVDLARDAGDILYADLCLAKDGDACPRCGEDLSERRGIEVGHVFQLGTKYSEALGATFLDPHGDRKPMVMGCYGIGVSRTLQSVIEQHHDENGICWPLTIAPYEVEVLVLNVSHEESVRTAECLSKDLEAKGLDVLYDDRNERPGVKFKDADVVGCPIRVAVGERSLAEGKIEVKLRRDQDVEKIPVADAVEVIVGRVAMLQREFLPGE